jgi:hypothetical protein
MEKLPVFMTVEEWQNVLNILAEHPYRQVKTSVEAIANQVSQALQARQGPGLAPGAGPLINGQGDMPLAS